MPQSTGYISFLLNIKTNKKGLGIPNPNYTREK
jgi:hypothetical protein